MKLIIGTCICIIGLMAFIIHLGIEDAKKWDAFTKAHHCVITGHISGDVVSVTTVNGNGGVGIGTAITPDKTGYKCDDGVTYWR